MQFLFSFLSSNPILAIFLSLAIGYLIGRIKIGQVTLGPTIGTLVVAFILSRFVGFEIPCILTTVFSMLFCFTLGYEAGPAFFKCLRSQGLKYVLQAVFFCASALLVLYVIGLTGILDAESIIGIAAGALTQSSILTVADHNSVAYAVTYIGGTVLAILFASLIGPAILRTDLPRAVRRNLQKNGSSIPKEEENDVRSSPVFVRAYLVEDGSEHIGQSVETLEDRFTHSVQVIKLFRGGTPIPFAQNTQIQTGDILTFLSPTSHFITLDDEYLREVGDRTYTELDLVTREIVVTDETDEPILDFLSGYGIVLRRAERSGRSVTVTDDLRVSKGSVLKVSGMASAIRKAAERLGYVKEIGDSTDVPFLFFALAGAVVLGILKIADFSFGESTCALILGLLCGWYNGKSPRTGKYPAGTRWFMKSVGLNLFIAVKGLTTGSFSFDSTILLMVGVGIVVTLLPHVMTLLFAKHALKMDDADILGGQCGSGTCTAALNTIVESTGSSVFVTSFATTNAIANILLTVVGVVLSGLL